MKKQFKFEWLLYIGTALIMLVMLFSHTYNDIVATTRHGINFWNILLNGQFLDFYGVNVLPSGNTYYTVVQGCAYNILVYIVFAIWNFPLYLLETLAGVDVMNTVLCLAYSKLLIVAGMVGTIILLKRILVEMKVSEKHHGLLLYFYASSTLMVTVVFITGQYDILSLVFQLLGFLAFLKGKDKAFVFWFGIAFCFKYFAAVVFLPLLVLRHKKVVSWIKYLVLLVVPVIITKAPFLIYGMLAQSTASAGAGGEMMAVSFLYNMLASAMVNSGINLFVVAYGAVIVWCFLREPGADIGHAGVWASMLSYGAFFGLMNGYPYWSILLAPFVTLAIAMAPKRIYLNTILETAGYAGLVGVNMLRYVWVYFGDTLKSMMWTHLLDGTGFVPIYTESFVYSAACVLYPNEKVHAVINAVFIVAIAALAYTTYPGKNANTLQAWPECKSYRDVLVVRFLINAVICMLPIIAIFL